MFDLVHFWHLSLETMFRWLNFTFAVINIMLTDLDCIRFWYNFKGQDQTRHPISTKLVCYVYQWIFIIFNQRNLLLINCRVIYLILILAQNEGLWRLMKRHAEFCSLITTCWMEMNSDLNMDMELCGSNVHFQCWGKVF